MSRHTGSDTEPMEPVDESGFHPATAQKTGSNLKFRKSHQLCDTVWALLITPFFSIKSLFILFDIDYHRLFHYAKGQVSPSDII